MLLIWAYIISHKSQKAKTKTKTKLSQTYMHSNKENSKIKQIKKNTLDEMTKKRKKASKAHTHVNTRKKTTKKKKTPVNPTGNKKRAIIWKQSK